MASSDNGNNQWYQPIAGLGSVGSYQVSAVPWATSSLEVDGVGGDSTEICFPQVTKFVVIKNLTSNALRVGFSDSGVKNGNHFVLNAFESFSADFRLTKIYLLGETVNTTMASIVAGLTSINSSQLPNSWSGSSGVG